LRTITAAQQQVLDSGFQAAKLRVSVKDAGGTWRDMSTYPGFDAVRSASIQARVDDPHMTLDVSFHRELDGLSLSPLMEDSALNHGFNPAAAFAPLVALGRAIKAEAAVVPIDTEPGVPDWMEVFSGKIDEYDAGQPFELIVRARDLSGRLAQQFIKRERVYGFAEVAGVAVPVYIWEPSTSYAVGEYVIAASRGDNDPGVDKVFICAFAGLSGMTEPVWTIGAGQADNTILWNYVGPPVIDGLPVEQVMQNILDDNKGDGDSTVTLYVPTTPAWYILAFVQRREFTLDALLALAKQIGWDLRQKYDEGTSAWRLTFAEPERSAPPVDATFTADDYMAPEGLRVNIAEIRNAWRLIYSDATDTFPDGTPKRKVVEVRDTTSIAKYGELWAEIQEESGGQISSAAEAQAFIDAALADCAEPTAELSVPLCRAFPWVVLNDFYEFAPDNVRFSETQQFAVTGFTHEWADGKLKTRLEVRGKPTIGAKSWLGIVLHPRRPLKTLGHALTLWQSYKTPTISIDPIIGGARAIIQIPPDRMARLEEYEHHISPTPDFTKDDSTLVAIASSRSVDLANLTPGREYWHATVPRIRNAERVVRGQPSVEQAFTAGRGYAGHLRSDVEWGRYPLNGGFENWFESNDFPDHWTSDSLVWGSNYAKQTGAGGVSGDAWVRYSCNYFTANSLESDPFTVEAWSMRFVTWWVARVAGSSEGQISLSVVWLDNTKAVLSEDFVDSVDWDDATLVDGSWVLRGKVMTAPATARFAKVVIRGTEMGDLSVDIDSVRWGEASEAWSAVAYEGSWDGSVVFRRDSGGRVQLRGSANAGTFGDGVDGRVLQLPVGCRPATDLHFPCVCNGMFAYVVVHSDGWVNAVWGDDSAAGVHFDSITFLADG
jgi:hypothetical protein